MEKASFYHLKIRAFNEMTQQRFLNLGILWPVGTALRRHCCGWFHLLTVVNSLPGSQDFSRNELSVASPSARASSQEPSSNAVNSSFNSFSANDATAELAHFQTCPPESSDEEIQDIKSLLKRGFALRSLGNYKGAIEKFDRAIAQDPSNYRSLLYRAQTLIQMQSYDAALKDFRGVLKLDPTNSRAWHGQGVAKAELRLYPSAVDSFDRAIACEPNNDKVWYNRGRALLKLEQHGRALESFDKAVELNDEKYHYWYNRALAQAALEQIQPAIESLAQTTTLKKGCHYAWNYRGTLLNRLFRHEEALKSFWESLQHRVPNPNAWYGLAATYALLDNPEAVAIHLTQAVQLNPSIYSLMARNDASFDPVRNHPKVAKLLRD